MARSDIDARRTPPAEPVDTVRLQTRVMSGRMAASSTGESQGDECLWCLQEIDFYQSRANCRWCQRGPYHIIHERRHQWTCPDREPQPDERPRQRTWTDRQPPRDNPAWQRKYMRYRSIFPVCRPLRRVLSETSEPPVQGEVVTGRFGDALAEGLLSTRRATNLAPTHPPGKGGGRSR